MKLLVTSFDPFGNDTLNSAHEALKMVPDEIDGSQIMKICLPVVFGDSMEILREEIRRQQPDAVLCLGQAGGRDALTPERVAINLNDARLPDNAGQQPIDETIISDGPDAYFSTLPIKEMVSAIRETDLPAEVSNTAGTYVCNQLMYGLMYFLSHEFPAVKGGFLHVPYLKEQVTEQPGKFGLPQEDLARGVTAAITAIIKSGKKPVPKKGKEDLIC